MLKGMLSFTSVYVSKLSMASDIFSVCSIQKQVCHLTVKVG